MGLVSQWHGVDYAGVELPVSPQGEGGRSVVRLARGQAEPDRQTFRVDECVDLGREAASGTTQAMISTPPLFSGAPTGCDPKKASPRRWARHAAPLRDLAINRVEEVDIGGTFPHDLSIGEGCAEDAARLGFAEHEIEANKRPGALMPSGP